MPYHCAMNTPEIDSTTAEQRIRRYMPETPVKASRWLGAQVYLKLENLQEIGAFKLRGAANKLLSLTPAQAQQGVVTASNGNHALAVASMGQKLGIVAEVFVSKHIDPARLARIEALGPKVRVLQGDPLLAEQTARQEGERSGRVYVSPYNDPDVIAGQGTVAVELLKQLPRLDAVFVAVGGGGLISGIGAHLKAHSPGTQVVGCWPENSAVLYECIRAGRIVEVEERPTISVSTAGGIEEGSITFPMAQRVIDRKVLVSESEIREALRGVYREDGELTEGAAGVAVAAFRKAAQDYVGKTVAIIICGGNADPGLVETIKGTA